MSVNLRAPDPASLLQVAGVRLGTARAAIRKPDRRDLLVVALDPGASAAGVFTRNRYCAAPVLVCREHLAAGSPVRALVVNTGNANAGTGERGLADARRTCAELARLLGCGPGQVLPFSTGVIMEPLPIDRLLAGLPACVADLAPGNWFAAAQAIMTTDTLPKAASRRVRVDGREITLTGIAKGAGMIHPNMATMLGFVATDAAVAPDALQAAVRRAADASFNRATVDGDTSTNDSFVLIATGRAGNAPIADLDAGGGLAFRQALEDLCVELAQAIVRDGEGATKLVTVRVQGGRDEDECRRAAFAIAHSPLVKTAFFASDPNLGRILAAVGNAGIADLDAASVRLFLDDVLVAEDGGRAQAYREQDGVEVMRRAEFTVRVELGRGEAGFTAWTCDFSHDYVTINAEYRT